MADKDTAMKVLFSNNDYFADLFNYKIFNGKQVIKPEDIYEADGNESISIMNTLESVIEQRNRDLLRYTIIKKAYSH